MIGIGSTARLGSALDANFLRAGTYACPFFASFFFGISVELLEKMEIKVYNENRMTLSGELRAA